MYNRNRSVPTMICDIDCAFYVQVGDEGGGGNRMEKIAVYGRHPSGSLSWSRKDITSCVDALAENGKLEHVE